MGFRKVTLGLRSLRSREWGFAIPSGKETFWFWSLKLAQVGTFFAFFRICSAFFGFPHSSWLFPSICFHFFRFFFDFSSIWGRFWEGFSMIFDTFFETCQNVWKSTKHCVGAWILKVDSYKSKQILPQNCKKNDANLRPEKNKRKNCSKIWFGRVLGSIWEGFGTLWSVLGPLLGAFWLLVGRSKSYLFKTMVQDGLQEAFWMAFGSILGGFGEDLDASWENLGIQN